MPVVTWDHVHLRSPDPEATASWLEDVLGGEIVDGLAQRADGHAEALGQLLFGWNRPALSPFPARQRHQHGVLDLFVQGRIGRRLGKRTEIHRVLRNPGIFRLECSRAG